MEQAIRTVVFADLSGSTGLFESAGDLAATRMVTQCTQMLARHFVRCGGDVVKYLGDGVIALFDDTVAAVQAAVRMDQALAEDGLGTFRTPNLGAKAGIGYGSVVRHEGDCYGDAVNVAARLSDRAQAGETLIGEAVYAGLPDSLRLACCSLDSITIKGKIAPQRVWRVDLARTAETTLTTALNLHELIDGAPAQVRIDLEYRGQYARLRGEDAPLELGRLPTASFFIDEARVSRKHARIEWVGRQCVFTDFSSNGSWIRFAAAPVPVVVRRASCLLFGAGEIGLGARPDDPGVPILRFRVVDEG